MSARYSLLRRCIHTSVPTGSRSSTTSNSNNKAPVAFLDLRGASGLSILERLCLEECILQTETERRNWIIAGCHEAQPHRYLTRSSSSSLLGAVQSSSTTHTLSNSRAAETVLASSSSTAAASPQPSTAASLSSSSFDEFEAISPNHAATIVLGIGGKPAQLLNLDAVRTDQVQTLRRFSGGGTVVLDHNSIWTTVIGRNKDDLVHDHFPRPIMEWTATALFGPMFQHLTRMNDSSTASSSVSNEQKTMVLESKSCANDHTGRIVTVRQHIANQNKNTTITSDNVDEESDALPSTQPLLFRLRENDYVLGERKMGGNAQSIGKAGWLHHTSFLWDYEKDNMTYLQLPAKRPEYRGDRDHADFLVKLHEAFPRLRKQDFFTALAQVCEERFHVERVTLPQAMEIVNQQGGIEAWLSGKSRTKVLTEI
jgi:lipoate-protein ligase A